MMIHDDTDKQLTNTNIQRCLHGRHTTVHRFSLIVSRNLHQQKPLEP